MKPLPAQNPSHPKPSDSAMPALPTTLSTSTTYSKANRRTSNCPTHRAYPWLLCTSTAIAGAFCLMYITKPVIQASQSPAPGLADSSVFPAPPVTPGTGLAAPTLMPSHDQLPGEKGTATRPGAASAKETAAPSRSPSSFEQTNLRIQHILTAEAPGGHIARIDLDVPVLYQSRNLRWTAGEVAKARELLTRLADYQEKSRLLRMEGAELLDSWNHLVGSSIPGSELRADSPTLPVNQQDAADAPRPANLDTTELIQIQPAKK